MSTATPRHTTSPTTQTAAPAIPLPLRLYADFNAYYAWHGRQRSPHREIKKERPNAIIPLT